MDGAQRVKRPQHHRCLLIAAILLTTTECRMRSAIWILQGSTASHLEFGISDKRTGTRSIQWGGLTVYSCQTHSGEREHVSWSIERDPNSRDEDWPKRVTYGEVPVGFRVIHEPETL